MEHKTSLPCLLGDCYREDTPGEFFKCSDHDCICPYGCHVMQSIATMARTLAAK